MDSEPTLEKSTKSSRQILETCVICLETITERAFAVPCNHCSFDFLCLVSWLQQHSTCPLCKLETRTVEYDWRSPEDYKSFAVESTTKADHPQVPPYFGHPIRAVRSRRYQRPHGRPCQPAVSPDTTLQWRRYIYRHKLYSLHVGANRISRFRNFTPKIFATSEELQSRARKWIRRELQVFDFLRPASSEATAGVSSTTSGHAEFLLEYIVAILKSVDIKSSTGQAEDMLQEFLGRESARLFLHELEAWLRSPYTALQDWDRKVQYRLTNR